MNQNISLKKIEWNGHCLQLRHPLEINVQLIDGFYEGYYKDLDMYTVALNNEQLQKNFNREFFVMWDVYKDELDEKLTKKARDIKHKICENIVKVIK